MLLRAYKGCAKLKDSYAKLQAKWIEITQDILTKNTKYCENSLYSQHEVRIVGNMFLHIMFDRFNKMITTNDCEESTSQATEMEVDDNDLLKRLIGPAVRRYKKVIQKKENQRYKIKIVDKIYQVTAKNGMTLSETSFPLKRKRSRKKIGNCCRDFPT